MGPLRSQIGKEVWQNLIKFKIYIHTYLDKDALCYAAVKINVNQWGNVINQPQNNIGIQI